MRRNRVKVAGSAYYHVMSRCALQQFLLTEEAKEMFLKILRRAEIFSGVRVINYCVMDNHFHVLVHVPQRREVPDDELDKRIRVLYGPDKAKRIRERWKMLRELKAEKVIEREQAAYRKRMFDISEFMKTFKQRFSLWYCSNHGNIEGTIWQGPFHSVLIEGRRDALNAVSAYITLNPVRAKLVSRPEDYRWGAYGAATAGNRRARAALLSSYDEKFPLAERCKAYASLIEAAMAVSGEEEAGVKPDATADKPSKGGKKKVSVMRVRNRDISRGVAFGSHKFVVATILAASNTSEVLTFPKAFCLDEKKAPLFCAGRRGA